MSRTVIADIRNNAFPALTVKPGTYVVWRNLDPHVHSAETVAVDPNYFTAGAMFPGETSVPVLFAKEGKFSYVCRYHTGMAGTITVSAAGGHDGHHDDGGHGDHDHGHHHGLAHLHGFVTGGRSADNIYMTHTPVLADSRHCYQVILRGRFEDPAHAKIYNDLRASEYGDQVVQIFHEHVSMPEIGQGTVKRLPNSSVAWWPGGSQTGIGPTQTPVEGLEENVPIALEEVIHFHTFDTEADYPDALTYILYGDRNDVFVDHFMQRAPSFHSVAKLAAPPAGWDGTSPRVFQVPGRAIRQLPPRLVSRMANVDNAFNLYWLLPPGALLRQAQDPLIRRGNPSGANHAHDIRFDDGAASAIEISRFLHFDIRLLNYGVLIV
jgi:hypothetical protein